MLLQDKICMGKMTTSSCAGDVNISDVTVLSEQQGLQSCLHVSAHSSFCLRSNDTR